jgi:hypothetical protein
LDAGAIYETPRELAKLVGTEGLVWRERNPFAKWPVGKDWRDLDLCLCGVDIPASIGRMGLRCERMTEDPMEFTVIR